jgi:hypothetical protein
MAKVVQGAVGPEFVKEMPAKMTSEDFSQYGQQPGVKAVLLHVGAVEPGAWPPRRRPASPCRARTRRNGRRTSSRP